MRSGPAVLLGLSLLGAAAPAGAFTLTSVGPRIFAPMDADDRVNKARFNLQNPEGEEISLRVYDRFGSLVRSNAVRDAASAGTSLILYWDGRDDKGSVVKGGVYLYKLDAAGKRVTGAVVVVR
ncbi:MAG: hypothetical protein HY925_12190 [Elusimicrobia bacterium]|nr:hypothetical protein [Elusimicrobiota bacterium]